MAFVCVHVNVSLLVWVKSCSCCSASAAFWLAVSAGCIAYYIWVSGGRWMHYIHLCWSCPVLGSSLSCSVTLLWNGIQTSLGGTRLCSSGACGCTWAWVQGQMHEEDQRKAWSWGAGLGRGDLSGRIGVLGNNNFSCETCFFCCFCFGCFGFFFSSAIKTCGWDPCVAETNAVPWLQSRSQQPFLVAGNKLSVCLCYRNKLSGLWAL